MDAEHADGPSAFDALGRVVQEDDDARIDAHRFGCGEIGLGCGLADADVCRVDERVEIAELGPTFEEVGAVHRVRVVREHPTRLPACFAARMSATDSGTTRVSGTTPETSRKSARQSSKPARRATMSQ